MSVSNTEIDVIFGLRSILTIRYYRVVLAKFPNIPVISVEFSRLIASKRSD